MNLTPAPRELGGDLPADYELVSEPGVGWCALRRDVAAGLRAAGFGLRSDGATRASGARGRAELLEIDAPPCRALGLVPLLRRHRRGGLPARLGRVHFPDPARPFDELRLSAALSARGVRTPAVLAARAVRAGRGYELTVVTARVPDAEDLYERFARAAPGERRALARAAGSFVAELFDAGLEHRDLHPKNLLVERGTARLWVLDLDRCALHEHLSPARRAAALARLCRWCLRRRRVLRPTRTEALRFLAAHASRGELGPLWRRLLRGARLRLLLRPGAADAQRSNEG